MDPTSIYFIFLVFFLFKNLFLWFSQCALRLHDFFRAILFYTTNCLVLIIDERGVIVSRDLTFCTDHRISLGACKCYWFLFQISWFFILCLTEFKERYILVVTIRYFNYFKFVYFYLVKVLPNWCTLLQSILRCSEECLSLCYYDISPRALSCKIVGVVC